MKHVLQYGKKVCLTSQFGNAVGILRNHIINHVVAEDRHQLRLLADLGELKYQVQDRRHDEPGFNRVFLYAHQRPDGKHRLRQLLAVYGRTGQR